MFWTLFVVYLWILALSALTTIVLILCGSGWGDLPHKYLKIVLLLQSYYTEDGVVLGSIERTKSAAHLWLFGRSRNSAQDDILEGEAAEDSSAAGSTASCERLDAVTTDDANSDFESNAASSSAGGGIAGGGSPRGIASTPFEWNLELVRDGIESVIQDEISDIFAHSAAYRNAEPHSLRDLFFHYSRGRKRRRRRRQLELQLQQQQRIAQQNLQQPAHVELSNNLEVMHEEAEREAAEQEDSSDNESDREASKSPNSGRRSATAASSSHHKSPPRSPQLSAQHALMAGLEGEGELPPLRFRPFLRSCLLLTLSRLFRIGVLFPIRLGILAISFLYLALICMASCFIDFSPQAKTKIAVIYCRFFTAGTGLIARYHNPENRPTRPGVAVANHLSPNDIQIICADVNTDREYLYIVTGQKHQGIIWTIEHLVERMYPSIWLERASVEDRKRFTQTVLDAARKTGPILIFPEGYCTNNQKVLQFRRAVFDEGIIIHPIAIRQDARFGDSYWAEDYFFTYLIRILTSWATVYDVYYLPLKTRRPNETSTEFASRVQGLIADRVGLECANFDATLFYKQSERQKYRKLWNAECAKRIQAIIASSTPSSSMSEGTTSTDDTTDRFETCVISETGTADFLHTATTATTARSRTKSVGGSDRSQTLSPKRELSMESLLAPTTSSSMGVKSVADDATKSADNDDNDSDTTDVEVVEPWDRAPDVRVLRRRRYNSLHILRRQASTGFDDSSDNAQLIG